MVSLFWQTNTGNRCFKKKEINPGTDGDHKIKASTMNIFLSFLTLHWICLNISDIYNCVSTSATISDYYHFGKSDVVSML